jgi:hypothetical protein
MAHEDKENMSETTNGSNNHVVEDQRYCWPRFATDGDLFFIFFYYSYSLASG